MLRRRIALIATILAVIIVGGAAAGIFLSGRPGASSSSSPSSSTSTIRVVAAENFWGSLVSQLGGTKVNVVSIVSNPNTDPHEYETNPADAIAITDAQFVIVNGAGYDAWALGILSAENTQARLS